MANLKILAVKFEIDVQKKAAQFSVPEEVCRLLGIEKGDVALIIEDTAGSLLFEGTQTLKSGKEIYGLDIRDCGVKPGQRIRVEVSLPPATCALSTSKSESGIYQQELDLALKAARATGDLLRQDFHAGFPNSLDKAADICLHQILTSTFPTYGYLSEELGALGQPNDAKHHLWLIDPQDGTTAAANGFRGAAVSIALLRDGLPVLGVVFAYCAPDDAGDLFWWVEGGSVYRNGIEIKRTWPQGISRECTALISQNADRNAQVNAKLLAPIRYRTIPGIAYRLALVAAGEGDLAMSLNSPTGWDVAGGHALLRGAGGDLFDSDGRPLTYDERGTIHTSLSVCYGGHPALLAPLLGRNWRKAIARGHGVEASDALTFLKPGENLQDAGVLARAQGCLLGQFAGDALGALVEFQDASQIRSRYPDGPRMIMDGGVWNTIGGQPTDDSEMALCLARAIVKAGTYDAETVARAYAEWLDSAPFDIGGTTRAALSAASRALRQADPVADASRAAALQDSEANGSLMRISPLGIFGAALPPTNLVKLARIDAGLTHPNMICRMAGAVFAAAVAYAIRTGRGAQATYDYALSVARSEEVAEPLLNRLVQAADRGPEQYTGWVLNAFQNGFYRLLHSSSFEEGVIDTVRSGGDTDTNAAIAGALLGAVHGRDAVPKQWVDRILSCRPIKGMAEIHRPRPAAYWPVDALALAERLLLAGLRTTGLDKIPKDELQYPSRTGISFGLIEVPSIVWDGVDQADPTPYSLTDDERGVVQQLVAYLPSLRGVDPKVLEVKSGLTPEGNYFVAPPEWPDELRSFFHQVYRAFGSEESMESPVPKWLAQPDFIERAQFPQLKRVLGWMLRGENLCTGFWCGLLQDGSLVRVLQRLSAIATA
jgi:ADP-ribosyl-[dinitrogen reductase] hydrolase